MHYIVRGGNKLSGEIAVCGAKNCALALLGASVLTKDVVTLSNCPDMADVENMARLLSAMGKKVQRQGDTLSVWGEVSQDVPQNEAALLRGSGLVLGSLIAAYGQAFLPATGGCAIGARPMDIHLEGLKAFGVVVGENGGVRCSGKPLGGDFTLRFPSVGATENLLCAATLAKGETILRNCALEPEVVALEELLVKMGAHLDGIGTSTIKIKPVKSLHGTEFFVIPDRIVAGTYLACAATTGGELLVANCCPEHFGAFLKILGEHHKLKIYSNGIWIRASRPKSYGNVATAPYPFFPTDLQSVLLSLCASCDGGTSFITETMFENRLLHNAEQLNRMGGNVTVVDNVAKIIGRNLHGAEISAADLRGGAALVVAALGAEGVSVVSNVHHIKRGYVDLAQKLASVGADITEQL